MGGSSVRCAVSLGAELIPLAQPRLRVKYLPTPTIKPRIIVKYKNSKMDHYTPPNDECIGTWLLCPMRSPTPTLKPRITVKYTNARILQGHSPLQPVG